MASSHVSHRPDIFTKLLTIMFIVSPFAHGASRPKPYLSPVRPSNSSFRLPTAPAIDASCTGSPAWLPYPDRPAFSQNCERALGLFHLEVDRWGGMPWEFRSNGTPSRTPNPACDVPRRYVFDQCTIAIALMDSFPLFIFPELLPAPPAGGWQNTDVATYEELYEHIAFVVGICTEVVTLAGWTISGRFEGLGLFVFATHSDVDRVTGGLEHNDA